MAGIYESSVQPMFHPNRNRAETTALEEASVTGALLCTVMSAQVFQKVVCLNGSVPRQIFQSRLRNPIKETIRLCKIRVANNSFLHTTWHQILNQVAPLGYLCFYPPIQLLAQGFDYEDDTGDYEKLITVNIEFPRKGESLLPSIFGLRLCMKCGEPISAERLKVVPETQTCVHCSSLIEKGGRNG